ncbi:MFS transporter [Segnochrobactrum spirostomi]|uniref:MFS transporter n=1 Tax=Segnochrobactrum spirostomi TaxID=2608987 RepID=A0A6A7Y0T9_9HYPH|nr:MFS transporter [Segnochrobactrum spirostomi]MQT12365.1 MFS transporter [Segnochrobactrum spirostomi]
MLAAAGLGWMFDGFENFGAVLALPAALRDFFPNASPTETAAYSGIVMSLNVLGFGLGGIVAGIAADYIGRKRVILACIAAYSLLSGLSALSPDWVWFGISRLLVGMALGMEWATGSTLLAEAWPPHARAKGMTLMQCCNGIGFMMASLIWIALLPLGPNDWRWMLAAGLLPALVALWIRTGVAESERWRAANARRHAAQMATASAEEAEPRARFTLHTLFADPSLRRRAILAWLMSLATIVGFWSISAWLSPYVADVAVAQGLDRATWAGLTGLAMASGSIAGDLAFGAAAHRFGRRPTFMAVFLLTMVLLPLPFVVPHSPALMVATVFVTAAFSLGQFVWLPIWLPELFPTALRATAFAFVANVPRIVSSLGPLIAGALVATFGGFAGAALAIAPIYLVGLVAAWRLPETRGADLPR